MIIWIVYFGVNEFRLCLSKYEAEEYARLFVPGAYRIETQKTYQTVQEVF